MASSSSYPSASAFSSQLWKYHVFLSFRGEDTRKTFVDHLYTALDQQGIYTYKDDITLPRGESIGSTLEKAIKESQIAVIVFSENYADSTWCLDELAYIMQCKDKIGQTVVPIFYHIDPSIVRKQKGKYGKALAEHELDKVEFWVQAILEDPCGWLCALREQIRKCREALVKHELENKNKVESWRKALVDASNVSGWEPKHVANGHEAQCIKEIVDTISHRLHPVTTSVDDNLVGVEARMQDLIPKLQIGSSCKSMIGIWGVGGGGKTTLASSIYDGISRKFDGCCFIKNIREESRNQNGVENLQAEILCGVLRQKGVTVGRVEEGRHMIKDRLQHRKVLIVLDDVGNLEHLEELVGSHDWFGEGSRILITTRDEHVLTAHKVDVIHNISLLNYDEAMKLFCKHAPRGHKRLEDYEQLSRNVISYAGGLPLALRVLGRFLCDKEMNEWRSALDRLKEIPDANILEKLKISFDGLTTLEKELFLDIACFFRGSGMHRKEDAMMILDACGFHPVIGIKVLIQKSLITISENGEFDMHDLVQEMAHHIVRGEHPNNPVKHSRVWKVYDVLKLCAMDGTENLDRIEVINYKCQNNGIKQSFLHVVAKMKKLRWLYMEGILWLETTPLPETFSPRELYCLTLNSLKTKQIWEGYKYLPNLRMLYLYQLNSLIKTPDFGGLPNLKRFIVRSSWSLEEIDSSFGHLEKLVWVEIQSCRKLKMLPPITRSKKLATLMLFHCPSLSNSSVIQEDPENVEHLQVISLSPIQKNVEHLQEPFLSRININHISLCLRKLELGMCGLEDGDINPAAGWKLPNLQELDLVSNNFSRLNFSLLRLPRLKYIDVSHCYWLVELSELPSSIAVVMADECYSLESLGDISNCKWLWKVSLEGNKKLGPLGDKLLRSMLQGNAKDYFISVTFGDIDIWRGFVPRLDYGKTFTVPLPDDWSNDFCGVLMFVQSYGGRYPDINIIMKQGVDKDFQFERGHESNVTTHGILSDRIFVGYFSFSSLRHASFLNSTYNNISISLGRKDRNPGGIEGWFRAVFIPRKSEDDPMQTTDFSEFGDQEPDHKKTFRFQHDSNSFINILWTHRPKWGS